ncbi:hypothetical protein C2845_PM12G30920 [Panicum miliaceum]|uniref:Uncharacterized protein n=1 Tax=Panicum miliaceum TaxID=4540 RepID=A0A3L6QBZ8_PANMI|nr:hypothetical protein C2845_PM12G30920 [Panicum miliaceum]
MQFHGSSPPVPPVAGRCPSALLCLRGHPPRAQAGRSRAARHQAARYPSPSCAEPRSTPRLRPHGGGPRQVVRSRALRPAPCRAAVPSLDLVLLVSTCSHQIHENKGQMISNFALYTYSKSGI